MNSFFRNTITTRNIHHFKIRSTAFVQILLTLSLLLLYAPQVISLQHARATIIDGPQTESSQELWKQIQDRTTPETVIVFRKPFVLSLYTGRKAHFIIPFEDQKYLPDIEQGYRENNVQYFVDDSSLVNDRSENWLRLFIDSETNMSEVWSNDRYVLYSWNNG